jgi:hypothetical protein
MLRDPHHTRTSDILTGIRGCCKSTGFELKQKRADESLQTETAAKPLTRLSKAGRMGVPDDRRRNGSN